MDDKVAGVVIAGYQGVLAHRTRERLLERGHEATLAGPEEDPTDRSPVPKVIVCFPFSAVCAR